MSDSQESVPATQASHIPAGSSVAALTLAALGVVYGDIGTSPLYAIKECFHASHGLAVNPDNVLGVLSLVIWSLIMVVSVKYLVFIIRAENKGEGGVFSLYALIPELRKRRGKRIASIISIAAIFGAALLYGDGIITPSISVLSAIEGLEVSTTAARPYVVPITCVILFALFSVQKYGTARVGRIFGPVMIAWFVTIALLGIRAIAMYPQVFAALSPTYAVQFFLLNEGRAFVVLGSVVLVVTGAEALYADMGHFGAKPIQRGWFYMVLPALVLNYMGQCAYLLRRPEVVENPFYGLVPAPLLIPMVILSTSATIIASQALITGAFSITRQAINLGFFPRLAVVHTSGTKEGQIYMPLVNHALMIGCISLVIAFRESGNLAAAYGLAVTGTMTITTFLYFFVATRTWKKPIGKVLLLVALFLMFDLSFLGSNLLKFLHGGWFPVVIAIGVATIMTTWKTGRKIIGRELFDRILPFNLFLDDVARSNLHRVPGTAVFMTYASDGTPPVILHHIRHNQVLHERVILLTVRNVDETPFARPETRLEHKELGHGFHRLVAEFGYMEPPDVPDILHDARRVGLKVDPNTTTYYLGRETLVLTMRRGLAHWRKKLFALMSKNELDATMYFDLPPRRVVELGIQVEL